MGFVQEVQELLDKPAKCKVCELDILAEVDEALRAKMPPHTVWRALVARGYSIGANTVSRHKEAHL